MEKKRFCLLCLFAWSVTLSMWALPPDAKKVTLDLKNVPMEVFLNTMKEKAGINMLYNSQMFKEVPPVTVKANKEEWESLLERVLSSRGFTYVAKNDIVVIKKKEQKNRTLELALIENTISNQLSIQKFAVQHFSGSPSATKLATTYDLQKEAPAELRQVMDGASKNCFSLFRYQDTWEYLFISKGNDLYLYYLKQNQLYKCAAFPSPITSIDTEYYNNKYIIVGLESGDAFIMKGYTTDASDENTIDKYVINQGQTIQVTGVDGKFVLYHEKDLGRIVQARYKPDNGNGWNEFDW